jgi:2,3-diketo-5-methylthio-1-phosphopentane phosphatase
MNLKLFVDSDGTITLDDVGNQFFLTFGGPACNDLVRQYHDGLLSAQELFRREAAAIGSVAPEACDAFIDRQKVSAGFPRFIDYCRSSGIGVAIVSDGLDYYINRILVRNGITGVPVFCNRLRFTAAENGKSALAIEFPYECTECQRCACCKRNIVLTRSGEDDIIGYIGEGFSDQCAAEYADIVFAKDSLQRYCQEKNISYLPYGDFNDVVARLETLTRRKRLRKRRRAELKRREAFVNEA